MLRNPWKDLPTSAPYILPVDESVINTHKNYLNLRLDTVPEPIVGGMDDSKILFLALNPGFTESDVTVNMNLSRFKGLNRYNLLKPYESDFYYFSGGLEVTGGYKWWTKKLKPILQAGVSEQILKRRIMMIEYFPYHSTNYHHINRLTPSQEYAFDLVREAIKREKIIIIMRSKKLWYEAVPELQDYPCMTLSSAQNVVISPKNIGELNFKTLLSELRD